MLQNVKITDTWVDNLDISGRVESLIVNGVDVTAFVEQELDKRHPELRTLAATDVDLHGRDQAVPVHDRLPVDPSTARADVAGGQFVPSLVVTSDDRARYAVVTV